MSNNLYFTVGMSNSGKSTLAQKWLKFENYIENGEFHDYSFEMRRAGYDYYTREEILLETLKKERRAVVSGDAIRESLGNLWNPDVEDYVDAIKFTMVKALLKTGHTVLIDETNTSERSIRKILELDIGAQVAVVPTSKEECLKRADISLHKPIERMYSNLEDLVISCNFFFSPVTVNKETIRLAVDRIKRELISHKEIFTNEPIRDTTAENTKLPKVSPISKPSRADAACCWSYTSPIVPEPGFQVY